MLCPVPIVELSFDPRRNTETASFIEIEIHSYHIITEERERIAETESRFIVRKLL